MCTYIHIVYRKVLLSLLRKKPARKSQLTNFINKLNAKQIRALEHIIRLFLRGRLKVSKSHFNRLRRHRGKLRQLIYAKPKTSTYRKKNPKTDRWRALILAHTSSN